ncbi:hypothetical protein A0H81_12639 [Grifola frondosa]|uniref:SPX domain-containing protein n=1 Tax=Grifola frondosa TaxID=5627 RepID=A0A1C7LRL6_GRIFR|nr:hypothetical protein A0H81_12639 [Grifola frondosa]
MTSSSILTHLPSPEPSVPDLPSVAHPHGDDTLDLAKHTSNQNDNVDNITDDSKTHLPPPPHSTTVEMTAVPYLRRRSTAFSSIIGRDRSISSTVPGVAPHAASTHDSNENRRFTWDLNTVIPLMELMPILSPVQRAFFEKLDAELDKVESFFCERERDMKERSNLLKVQLQELQDHRRAFYEAHPIASAGPSWMPVPLPFPILPSLRWRSARKNEASPHAMVKQTTARLVA